MNSFGGPPEMYAIPPEQDIWRRRVDELRLELYSRRRALLSRQRAYYWRIIHINGNVMGDQGQPQGYSRAEDRQKAIELLWPDIADVVDLDKEPS